MADAADDGLDPALSAALERLDELVEAFELDPDPGIPEMATELLQAVDTIHRAGLTRLADYLAQAPDEIQQRALGDPPVRLLFELYDLAPATPPSPPSTFISLDDIVSPES